MHSVRAPVGHDIDEHTSETQCRTGHPEDRLTTGLGIEGAAKLRT
jgi:hypothetical protein